jgi:tetratricopeptide (TPR) repeat protein
VAADPGAGDQSDAPAATTTSVAAATAHAPVGREREQALLLAALERARDGHGSCVLVAGEAGIGKSTLVEQLIDQVPPQRVLRGRCHEAGGAPAYWPWVQVLRTYVRERPADALALELGSGAVDLARMLPALRERLPQVDAPVVLDPDEARFLLFDAVNGLLSRAAADEVLVVALEDLHWADRDSLLLLLHVAAELRGTRLLILGTYREAELRAAPSGGRLLGDLARLCERLTLAGLAEVDVGALVGRLTGAAPAPELVASLHRTTDGNPFFVAEVVELLRAEGGLVHATGLREGSFRIPDTVREAILRRLDPLPPETRRLLGVAAVLGREMDLAVVAAVAGQPSEHVLADLEPALDLGLMSTVAERSGQYRFAHALLRHTLEDELAPPERAELHLRAGEALERLHALDLRPLLGEIAQHFLRAASIGGRERAIEYAFRAGRRALDSLGYEDAIEHFSRAAAAQRAAGGDPRTLPKLLYWLGVAQRRGGAEAAARETLLEVARLARELGDVGALARATLNAAVARAETGVVDTVLLGLLEETLARLEVRDTPLRAHVMGTLARCLYFTTHHERREALSVEALAIARRTGDASALSATLEERHFVLWRPGTTRERLALATEMVRVAEQVEDRETECDARTWRVLDLLELGEMAEAADEQARSALAAEHLRSPRHRWQATVTRAALALFAGRIAEAEALAVQALSLRQAGASNNMKQFFAVQMFHIRRAQGRQAEMLLATAEPAGRPGALPVWRCGLAQLEAELGDLATARVLLDELAADDFAAFPHDANYLPALAALAETAYLVGAAEPARRLYELLLPHADMILVTGLTAVILGPVQRFLGLLALTAGRHESAVDHLEAAVERCAQLGANLDLGRARTALAVALVARGRPGDAERAGALDALRAVETTASVPGDGTVSQADVRTARQEDARPLTGPAPRTGLCRREGDFWTIACGAEVVRLKGTKGVEYLATLLAHPGRELHALELEGGERAGGSGGVRAGDAGEALDGAARQAYRRRLDELAAEIAAARDAGDEEAIASHADEQRALERELARAVGLGGRARRVGSDAERARINVTRALGSVLKKIRDGCPELGRHLDASLATGTFCSYAPPPDGVISWQTGAEPAEGD